MKNLVLILVLSSISLMGCSSDNSGRSFSKAKVARQSGGSFAHEHRININISNEDVSVAVQAIINSCEDDKVNECTLLASDVSAGDYSRGELRLRLSPEGIDPLIELAESYGSIISISTTVEDLTEVLADYETRLEMLIRYREQLQTLELRAENDIDSLIKVAEELTTVQSKIESLTGEQNHQIRRTLTDIVNISFTTYSYTSFFGPISSSIRDFGEDLSEGIASVITGAAYVIPWLIFLFPFLYMVRKFWKRKADRNA